MAGKRQMTGMLGVYLVAAELSRRGFIVSPTSRSAAGASSAARDDRGTLGSRDRDTRGDLVALGLGIAQRLDGLLGGCLGSPGPAPMTVGVAPHIGRCAYRFCSAAVVVWFSVYKFSTPTDDLSQCEAMVVA